MKRSQLATAGAYLPFLLVFFIFPEQVLGLFGPEFRDARSLLFVVVIAQGINCATGMGQWFLTMTKAEGLMVRISSLTLILMLGLIVLLGSSYGALGVAWAFAIGHATKSVTALLVSFALIARLERDRDS